MNRPEHVREILEQPLDRLDACGLHRPASLNLTRYLGVLNDHGLFSVGAMAEYLELYQSSVHGGQPADPEAAARAATRLLEELDGNPDRLSRAATVLAELSRDAVSSVSLPPRRRAPAQAVILSAESVIMPRAEGSEEGDADAPHAAALRRPPRWHQRWSVRLAGVVLYSFAVLATGYLAAPRISQGLEALAYHAFGAVRSRDVDALREQAGAEPDNIGLWQQWAHHAERRGRWAEALLAHRHIVARRPNDPNLLNAFAWFLCTAEEPWARDPVQALELAERAYALDPAPHITDTLAEAAFQNGDAERAVALEKDAIQRLNGNDTFYRRQLRKFESALPRASQPNR